MKPTVKSEETSLSKFKAEVETSKVWVKIHSIKLHDEHKEMILNGSKLNDLVINVAQLLLKKQFLELLGLQSTLLLKKLQPRFQKDKLYI